MQPQSSREIPFCKHSRAPPIARAPGRRLENRQSLDLCASIAVTKDPATPPGYARWGALERPGKPAPFHILLRCAVTLLFRPYGPKTPCRTPNFGLSLRCLRSSPPAGRFRPYHTGLRDAHLECAPRWGFDALSGRLSAPCGTGAKTPSNQCGGDHRSVRSTARS